MARPCHVPQTSADIRRHSQTTTTGPMNQEDYAPEDAYEADPGPGDDAEATRRDAGEAESSRASRGWWDRNADEYQSEHGAFLGDDRFVWGPEGLDEAEAALLGPAASLKDKDVLEIGSRRRPVLALAGGPGRPPRRPRPLPPPAPARPAHRR